MFSERKEKTKQNLGGCRHVENVSFINIFLSERVDVVEDR